MEKQTKEMALEKARKDYKRELRKINKAFELMEQIEPSLPEGWEANYNITLNINKWETASSSEFRKVCQIVKKVAGGKLEKRIKGNQSHQSLCARLAIRQNGEYLLAIEIQLFGVDATTCKLTFKKETITKVITDPVCLGIEPEEKTKENNI